MNGLHPALLFWANPVCAGMCKATKLKMLLRAASIKVLTALLCFLLHKHGIKERGTLVKMKKGISLLLAAACAASLLGGCAASGTASAAEQQDSSRSTADSANGTHEPLTICAPSRNVVDLINVVHEKYPEINFEVMPYAGPNGTTYMVDQILSDNQADIYSASYYIAESYDLSDKLMDLSSYAFTDNYVPARLREVNENGAIYLLPSYYNCLGITYNKKILRDNGWELPTSLQEMEELAPKVEAAGYRFALAQIGLPGYGFQYLCNILDTSYLSTMDGRKWRTDFLNGDTTLEANPQMMQAMQLLDRWRDIGLLNGEMEGVEDGAVCEEMAKGNTLFMLGSSNSVDVYGANVEDFGLMPYLSEDGSQNVYVLMVNRYMGLSKKLEEPGNEQKLQDALHVMEVISTQAGAEALNANFTKTSLSPLKDAPNIEGSFYNDIVDDINAGYTAPFIYSGWDNMIVPVGNMMIDYICGKKELDDVITEFDASQSLLTQDVPSFTTAGETISTEKCAELVGIAFAQGTGADLSLVSIGGMDPETGATNAEGVNGQLFPLPVTEQEVCVITPTGWNGNIQTVELTGKRIKEIAETGYNRKERGYYFPYLLVCKDGMEIADDTVYTVAICGIPEELKKEGNIQDSGVLGMQAMEDYLSQFDTLTESDIIWE